MTTLTPILSTLVALFAMSLAATPASAANTRSFISASGLDTNSCARAAPCRTLAFAITQTNAGGEINMLDPGGYGPVTIDKAISIVNDGVGSAGILVPSFSVGISINAGPTDAVNLRGLIIEGAGVGSAGIQFHSGKSLTIENCVIRNNQFDGLDFLPNAQSTLAVSNTYVADNGNFGIVVEQTAPGVLTRATISRTEIHNSGTGLAVLGGSNAAVFATVADSVAAGNNTVGMKVSAVSGVSDLTVVRSVIANNATGLIASSPGANAFLFLAQSTVTGNSSGWSVTNSGTVLSAGDNTIEGNGAGQTAPGTYTKK